VHLTQTKNAKLNILLADDDAVDRELFAEGMAETGVLFNLTEASNGIEVLRLVEGSEELPDMIILDLNMPVMDGRTTLKELKSREKFRHIPVFILSTSNAHFDVTAAYGHGANLFLVKPDSFTELVNMLNCLFTIIMKYAYFSRNNG